MSRFAKAFLASIAVHAVLAAALAVYLGCVPLPELPRLDLTAVELSFTEQENATAPAAESPPSPPPPEPEPQPPPPPEPEPEPEPPPPELEPEPEPEPEPPPPPEPEPEPEPEPPPPGPEPEPEPEDLPSPDGEAPSSPEPEPEPPPQQPAAAPAQARIDAPPRPTKPINAVYPTGARQRNEEGDVVVEFSVSAQGRVTEAFVAESCGYPELDDSALLAVKKARFVPARSGRRAVPYACRMTIEFRIK